MRRAILCILVWLCFAAGSAEEPRVRFIGRWPGIVPAGEAVDYTIRVERRPEHALFAMAAFDESGIRVSYTERQLYGEDSSLVQRVRWALPEGHMRVIAAVFSGQAREVGRDERRLIVVP